MKKKTEKFKLVKFRWLLLVDAIVIIAAVMSFGMVAIPAFHMNQSNAVFMLCMIPPMTIAVILSTTVTLHSIRKRMSTLLNGIQAVADGDLDVRLDSGGAQEYAEIYNGFNRMTEELKKTKHEMQNFVNEFSHEFKTPITSISGFAQLLIDTGENIENSERMQYLKVIADESLRLSALSQNTLLLSKVEACEIITEKEDYNLSEQLKRCAILLLPKIEQKKIELELDVGEIIYRGNAELMEQVWINLLNNAIRFTPDNGDITISAVKSKNGIQIGFIDSGIGMDKDTIPHIFEKYYQHDTVNAVHGNGIGLSIVYRIITLCGGQIKVESSPGTGSTFTITLPQ